MKIRAGFQALLFSEHLGYQRHWWCIYACSPLEIACQNIFMQGVVSPKGRLIDVGQHPTGSWVNKALICLDKTELYSYMIIWLPEDIHAFCHLGTLSSLFTTSEAKARQAASLTQVQHGCWQGVSCRSKAWETQLCSCAAGPGHGRTYLTLTNGDHPQSNLADV